MSAPGPEPGIGGIVLAAGAARRAGGVDKLLATVDGTPLVRRVTERALEGGLAPVVVVAPPAGEAVRSALRGLAVEIVENPDADRGLSSSLRRGLAALPPDARGVVVLLGDMPWVTAGTVRTLAGTLADGPHRGACVPVYRGRRGNPVAWSARFFPEMAGLEGDEGARSLLGRHADQVHEVVVDDPGILRDVDTPEDLAALVPKGGAPCPS